MHIFIRLSIIKLWQISYFVKLIILTNFWSYKTNLALPNTYMNRNKVIRLPTTLTNTSFQRICWQTIIQINYQALCLSQLFSTQVNWFHFMYFPRSVHCSFRRYLTKSTNCSEHRLGDQPVIGRYNTSHCSVGPLASML